MMVTAVLMALMVGCGGQHPQVDPVPVDQGAVAATQPDAEPVAQDPTRGLGPRTWGTGSGSTEIWYGGRLVGLNYVVRPAKGSPSEYGVFFGESYDVGSQPWDPDLQAGGIGVMPAASPWTGSALGSSFLTIQGMRACTEDTDGAITCGPCDDSKSKSKCYDTVADFKKALWCEVAQRMGRSEADIESAANTGPRLVESVSWQDTPVNVTIGDPVSKDEFVRACSNGAGNELGPHNELLCSSAEPTGCAVGQSDLVGRLHLSQNAFDPSQRVIRQVQLTSDVGQPTGATRRYVRVQQGSDALTVQPWCGAVAEWCAVAQEAQPRCLLSTITVKYLDGLGDWPVQSYDCSSNRPDAVPLVPSPSPGTQGGASAE